MIKTLKEVDIRGKRVILRCDFNVPLNEKGEIEDDFRIKQSIPTIKYLLKNRAKVIIISHLGDPNGEVIERLRLNPVAKLLTQYLEIPIEKASDCVGKEVEEKISKLRDSEILILENLRFHIEEQNNDERFSKKLAEYGDFYINDAFSVCHREHASIVGLPKYLPAVAGLLLEKEFKVLSRVIENPWRPLVVIIGGAKIIDKLKLVKQFVEKADHVLVGGKIANAILRVKGICLGLPWPEEDIVKEVEGLKLTSTKLHLPVDALMSPNDKGDVYVREAAPGKLRNDELLLDIGSETIKFFTEIIKDAKMIIWAGPLGFTPNPLFENGTKKIAEAIARNHKAYKIAGGGDTILALSKFNLIKKFDHISTGGGAMLSFLSGKKLPGIEVLKR
jgi:phosphoglycerate kinase